MARARVACRPVGRRHRTMNRVLLTGRLTRDPELRTTAGGKAVAQFSVASHEYVGGQGEAGVPQRRHVGPARRDLRPVPRQGPAGRGRGPDPDPDLGRRPGQAPLEDRDRRLERRDAVRRAARRTTRRDGLAGARGAGRRERDRARRDGADPRRRGLLASPRARTRTTRRTSSSRTPRPPDPRSLPRRRRCGPPPVPSPAHVPRRGCAARRTRSRGSRRPASAGRPRASSTRRRARSAR